MRRLWSEEHKRLLWRQLWVVLAEVQAEFGLVEAAQVDDLRGHQEQIDVDRSLEIEAEIHHDLMAELKCFAEQASLGGGILHLGATSADIEDNADALRMRQSLDLTLRKLGKLLGAFVDQVEAWAEVPVMAYHPPAARRADHIGLPPGPIRSGSVRRLAGSGPGASLGCEARDSKEQLGPGLRSPSCSAWNSLQISKVAFPNGWVCLFSKFPPRFIPASRITR